MTTYVESELRIVVEIVPVSGSHETQRGSLHP